jgi:DNA-directed RNA polymerase subunit F
MAQIEIIEKTPMNLVELKTELKKIQKRDGELTFRGGKTEEYLNDFASMPKKSADELVEKLKGLNIARLKDEFIHKIVDFLPDTAAELKIILQGYTLSLNNDDLAKIVKIVKDYC